MRRRVRSSHLALCVGGIALAGWTLPAVAAAPFVDGTLSSGEYGANTPGSGAIQTQTINTGFGNSNYTGSDSGQPDANGSELDAAYGTVSGGNLYLFFSGDFENNGNHVDVFIDDGRAGGQNTLNASGTPLNAMNGSVFSPGFNATYALDLNDFSGSVYVNQFDFTTGSDNYISSVPLTNGIGATTLSGVAIGWNNTNISTMGASGAATSSTAAQSVNVGLELGIPLSALGNPTSTIKVLADINGGGDSFLSNQFLPGLPVGTANVGGGGTYAGPSSGAFNLSSLSNFWIAVPVPAVANGEWLPTGGGGWETASNWSNNYIPGTAASGDAATFTTAAGTTTAVVNLDGNRTVGSVSFNNSIPYTIAQGSGTGSLILDNTINSASASITDFGGNHTISAPVILTSNAIVNVVQAGNAMTISGNISGGGGLTITNQGGASNVLLSGTNTYGGGTTVTGGNLQLGSSTALPTGTALSLSAADVPAGVLDLNGNNATVSSIVVPTGPHTISTGATAQIINTSAAAGTATLTYAGTNTNPSNFTGKINDSSGSGGSTTALHVASGSLTLSGTNTYAGTTTIDGGATLVAASTTGTAIPTGGNISNNGAFVANDNVNSGNISGAGTTTVNNSFTLTTTNFTQSALVNNGAANILGSGTVGPISGTGALTLTGGTLTLAPGSGASTQGSLTVNAGSSLDLTTNGIVINYGSAGNQAATDSTILSYLSGASFSQAPQAGTSIVSSSLATNTKYAIGEVDGNDGVSGSPVAANTLEIAYTLQGDLNLDGVVNGTDFSILVTHFGQPLTGIGWEQGDINGDGIVNGSDFSALVTNFGAFNNSTAGLDNSTGGGLVTVPEPASVSLLALGAVGLLSRRQRRSRPA